MHSAARAMETAQEYCARQKQRLTKPRIEVLKIISKSSKPLGAYEILDELAKVLDDPKPPTVYRAIDFWVKSGFIHRVESLNAYIICDAERKHRGVQVMICDDCGKVTEAHFAQLAQVLDEGVGESSFTPLGWNIEIRGLCSQCALVQNA